MQTIHNKIKIVMRITIVGNRVVVLCNMSASSDEYFSAEDELQFVESSDSDLELGEEADLLGLEPYWFGPLRSGSEVSTSSTSSEDNGDANNKGIQSMHSMK